MAKAAIIIEVTGIIILLERNLTYRAQVACGTRIDIVGQVIFISKCSTDR